MPRLAPWMLTAALLCGGCSLQLDGDRFKRAPGPDASLGTVHEPDEPAGDDEEDDEDDEEDERDCETACDQERKRCEQECDGDDDCKDACHEAKHDCEADC